MLFTLTFERGGAVSANVPVQATDAKQEDKSGNLGTTEKK
jgi:hypothetical protein